MKSLALTAALSALLLFSGCSTVNPESPQGSAPIAASAIPVKDVGGKTDGKSTAKSENKADGKTSLGSVEMADAEVRKLQDPVSTAKSGTDKGGKELAQDASKDGQNTATAEQQDDASKDPLNDAKSVLAKRSIYFDYDSFEVKKEFRNIVEAHGKYLQANPKKKILIQGHTDERGGAEYNLALGQKRAESVKKILSLLGAKEEQLEAVSLGKEKPKAIGSDEASWAENRRVDLVY